MAARNLFGELALDTTLQAVRDRLGDLLTRLGQTLTVHVDNPTSDPETGLAKDGTARAVLLDTDTMAMLLQRMSDLHDPLRALTYAKAIDDSIRATVGGSVTTSALNWANNNSQAAWFSTGAPNSLDLREQQRLLSDQFFTQVRQGRWQVT